MQIRQIEIRNFRNYLSQSIHFQARVNLFLGDNGQGKTNLLEAIYLLTKGVSFRPGKTETFIHHNSRESMGALKGALLSATIQKESLESQVKISLSRESKSYLINGKRSSAQALVQNFPSILFSPESLGAIKEGPEARRQLIDEAMTALNVNASHVAQAYSRCLRAKNRLLRDFKKGLYQEQGFKETLESLNSSFLPLACRLTQMRIAFIKDLVPDLQRSIQFIFSPKNVDISVDYSISSQSALEWEMEEIVQAQTSRLKDLQRSEIDSGVALVGPHKHDLRFLFAGEDARYFCSQGQQRALILSVKMAQIMYHQRVHGVLPFLLLDDVLSELDPEKRARLVAFLKQIKPQIFLTSTDLSFPLDFDFGDKDVDIFQVKEGVAQRQTC